MHRLPLTELHAALKALLGEDLPLLRRSSICAGYEQALRHRLDALDALLPPADTRPLAVAADIVDLAHDGFGAAIHALCEAYRWLPDAPDELRAAAAAIQAAFVPSLAELASEHAAEARAAAPRAALRETLRAELARFPVGPAGDLGDWVDDFLSAAERLGALASLDASTDELICPEAYAHRAPIARLLHSMRTGLRDELACDPSLPRELEQRLFGRFDVALRAELARRGR